MDVRTDMMETYTGTDTDANRERERKRDAHTPTHTHTQAQAQTQGHNREAMQERLATYVIPSNYRQIREEHKMVHPPWPWAGREVVPYTLPLHTTRYTPHPGFVKAGREVVNPKFYILSSKRNTPPETRTQTTKAPSRSRGGVAWRGVAWRGVAWRGVAWRGVHALRGCVCMRVRERMQVDAYAYV
jgi:hypothetical protein